MKKNQTKWMLIAFIVIVIFIFITPMYYFLNNSLITSMVEASLVAFIIYLSVLNIDSISDLSDLDENEKSKNISSLIIPFGSFILFSFIIYFGINYRIDSLIRQKGIFTKAKIVDGYQKSKESLNGRKSTTFNVIVEFSDTTNKKDYKVFTEINQKTYDLIYKEQEIEIKYLKSDPNVLKLIIGDENIKKFKKN